MKPILLHPAFFAPVSHYALMAQADTLVFENNDNYQKQTYRNRTYIYGANGKLLLNIPIQHTGDGSHQKYRDVKIENNFDWQKHHWKSLQSAYRGSAFFEFYEDEIAPLFMETQTYLLDFNYRCQELTCECLQLDLDYSKTEEFFKDSEQIDLRETVNAKTKPFISVKPYFQVFEDKKGFIPNLSILDLLFNEGTNALTYLEELELPKL